MKLVIEIPNCEYCKIISNIPHNELEYAIKNGSIISDNAHNSEVIRTIFPNLEVFEESPGKVVWGRSQSETKWWNSPYKNELNKEVKFIIKKPMEYRENLK